MAITVHQSASAIDTSGAMTVTLGSATTNGRYLIVLYGAVANGQAQSVSDWTEILDQACTTGGVSTGRVYAAWRQITANEDSITLTGVSGTGNQYAALYEVSCSIGFLQVTDTQVNDISGTGTTIALGAVTAVNGDLVMALALFHDDDGTDMSWSNSFGSGPIYRETSSGTPQLGAESAYLLTSGGSISTTATVSGGPSSDERHGFMVTIHELSATEIAAGIGESSLGAGIGDASLSSGIG